jgi:hypothetical protein
MTKILVNSSTNTKNSSKKVKWNLLNNKFYKKGSKNINNKKSLIDFKNQKLKHFIKPS